MTDWREIEAFKKNPDRARSLAEILGGMKDFEWTDWEADFLEDMSTRTEELTTRQSEKLVELRDATKWYSTIDGFSVPLLIENCWRNRDLLGDADVEFIGSLRERMTKQVRRRQGRWLVNCARRVGAIEHYQGRSLDPPKHDDDD
jgi:hypothetical protein